MLSQMRRLVLDRIKPEGCEDSDPGFDLNQNSTFLDVGAGYGKVVLHAKVMHGVRQSCGIECVFSRYRISADILESFKEDMMDWLPEYKRCPSNPTFKPNPKPIMT